MKIRTCKMNILYFLFIFFFLTGSVFTSSLSEFLTSASDSTMSLCPYHHSSHDRQHHSICSGAGLFLCVPLSFLQPSFCLAQENRQDTSEAALLEQIKAELKKHVSEMGSSEIALKKAVEARQQQLGEAIKKFETSPLPVVGTTAFDIIRRNLQKNVLDSHILLLEEQSRHLAARTEFMKEKKIIFEKLLEKSNLLAGLADTPENAGSAGKIIQEMQGDMETLRARLKVIKAEKEKLNSALVNMEKELENYRKNSTGTDGFSGEEAARLLELKKEVLSLHSEKITLMKKTIELLGERQASLELAMKLLELQVARRGRSKGSPAITEVTTDVLEAQKTFRGSLVKELEKTRTKLSREQQELEKERNRTLERLNKYRQQKKTAKDEDTLQTLDLQIANNERKLISIDLKEELANLKPVILSLKVEGENFSLHLKELYLKANEGSISEDELKNEHEKIKKRKGEIKKELSVLEEKLKLASLELSGIRKLQDEVITEIYSLEDQIEQGTLEGQLLQKKRERLQILSSTRETILDEMILMREKIDFIEQQIEIYRGMLNSVDEFEKALAPRLVWMLFGNTLADYLRFLLYLALTWLAGVVTRNLVLRIKNLYSKEPAREGEVLLISALRVPACLAIYILGIYLALTSLNLSQSVANGLFMIFKGLVILDITYLFIRLVDVLAFYARPFLHETASKLGEAILPLLVQVSRIVLLVIGFGAFMENFGYPVTSIMAGLGLGGLAFALAAQDTLSNFFGSLMIFTDKVFQVGDVIRFDSNEGVVEEIGIRSTRIRRFDDTMIIVPNSVVAKASVVNVTRFRTRRSMFNIGLVYETPPGKIRRAVEIIKEAIQSHPLCKPECHVAFEKFGESSLDLVVCFYVTVTAWGEFIKVNEAVLLTILERFIAEDIRIAYPTRSLRIDPENFGYALDVLKKAGFRVSGNDTAGQLPHDSSSS